MVVRKVGSRIDPALIRLTGGRLSFVAPFPAMLLTHTGAKSGVTRTSTVVYFTDADRVIVIASNLVCPIGLPGTKRTLMSPCRGAALAGLFTPGSWWVRNATGFSNSLLAPPRRTTTSANGAKTRPRHRLSPEPLTEAIAQRAGEPEFGAALRCLAVRSAYWAGHPEVNA
jgi:hypothetical protein